MSGAQNMHESDPAASNDRLERAEELIGVYTEQLRLADVEIARLREALDDIAGYAREAWTFSERLQAILDTVKRVRS